MRTPAGNECPFFFGDYYRGRNREQCNLIGNVPAPRNWKADLCKICQVPSIILANGCKNMTLSAEVQPGFLKVGRKVKVRAYCTKTHRDVQNPFIGCGECHDDLVFSIGDEE